MFEFVHTRRALDLASILWAMILAIVDDAHRMGLAKNGTPSGTKYIALAGKSHVATNSRDTFKGMSSTLSKVKRLLAYLMA